jgi:predicted Zn-dependent protease
MDGQPSSESPAEAAARAADEERARQVEVGFLEAVRSRLPEHPAVIESLGCLYTEMGRYQEGLRADRDMVRLQPHSELAWYNLACSLSLTGQADDAFAALAKAIALGYDDAEWMQSDDDFAPIRSDPRFARLLAQLLAKKA